MPPHDAHDLLRACHTRRLDSEGIPMMLAVVDERADPPARTPDPALAADGDRCAELLVAYADELVPTLRPDDEGALITALQVVAYAHFEPEADR